MGFLLYVLAFIGTILFWAKKNGIPIKNKGVVSIRNCLDDNLITGVEIMRKAVVKKEVSNAIKTLRKHGFENNEILRNLSNDTFNFDREDINTSFKVLADNHYTFSGKDYDELVFALYEGYTENLE